MKKLLVNSSIVVALGLAGCGGETISDVRESVAPVQPITRIVFDPASGNLNIPNDLLLLPGDDGFFDFTLNIPVTDPSNFGDPQNALNVLDGWSTTQPFVINVNASSGISLDESTLSAGIHLYEATLGLNQGDPDCAAVSIPSAGCKVGDKLVFGQDYVLSLADGDTVAVVPLRPLKSGSGYVLVMTTDLKDSTGSAVQGSTTWDLVKQDITTNPLSSAAQLRLQGLINSHITALQTVGLARENISYVAAFTTHSVGNTLSTLKQLSVSEFAQRLAIGDATAGQALPVILAKDVDTNPNAMEALNLVTDQTIAGAVAAGSQGLDEGVVALINASDFSSFKTCNGLLSAASGQAGTVFGPLNEFAVGVSTAILQQVGPFCAASRYEGEISLPYYSGVPSQANPLAPVNTFWTAACDSGIVLAGATADVLAGASPGENAQLCNSIGLNDLQVGGNTLDKDRHVTQYNPVPQMTGTNSGKMDLEVQITVPNSQTAAALGRQLVKPDSGWPVVILGHGITSRKEAMLAISGALSLAGYATIAIDLPLHGSRGFDLNGDGVDELNTTTVSATHYMNLGLLPATRDNLRQSVVDFLGLRLGINAIVDTTTASSVDINAKDVSYMGVSLGGIVGVDFAAIANQPFTGALEGLNAAELFSVQVASLESPGGGIAAFLLESPAFGSLIKGNLLKQASTEFQALLLQQFQTIEVTEAQLVATTNAFLGGLSPEQTMSVNAIFNQFIFAAQTVIGSGDPINYAGSLIANTPVQMLSVVGDGGDNLPDQVIPIVTATPLSGQQALANAMMLEQISASTQMAEAFSGITKFTAGAHASSLNPSASPAVTTEMQLQIASYIASKGRVINMTDTSVVQD